MLSLLCRPLKHRSKVCLQAWLQLLLNLLFPRHSLRHLPRLPSKKQLLTRNCWTVLIMMMNQKLEKKLKRMKHPHSPLYGNMKKKDKSHSDAGVVLPGQSFPVAMPTMGHSLPGQPLPGSAGHPGFPGAYPSQNAAHQHQIAWALNKGIKPDFKQYWDVELGVTYIPWSKVREDQLEELKEGGMLDMDTLSPAGPPGPGGHPGNIQAPSGGLLGARPGMIPLQRPQVPPLSQMQRFPPPHGPRPPHPNMPPGPPQMIPRGPHPPMMRHKPPQPKGGFGMPPQHNMRGPFPRGHGPSPQGPAPFIRPGGPRSFEGQEEMDDRPLRGDRPGFRDREQERDRDWDRDRERDRGFGGGRRFGDAGRGGGSDKMDGRDRLGGWQEDIGSPRGGGWERDRDRDRDRDRRDWRERRGSLDRERERGRGDDGERDRGRAEGGERSRGEAGSRDKARAPEGKGDKPRRAERRERTSRWDKDDRLAELENMDKFRSSNSTEQSGVTPSVTVETRKEPNEEPTKKKDESEHLPAEATAAAENPPPSEPKEPAQSEPSETKEEAAAASSS
ncbi:hypothetical protein XENOCAPTIV_002441 [Xenoophorus captivus]|uniref:Uncharacterized protein n=1 Tax=Xenoophorus captivus TaxID=1517983 RepID=A0ABV0RDH5_9TELE